MTTAIHSRAKPQEIDVRAICIQNRRVFIGYPLRRMENGQELDFNPQNIQDCLVNPVCEEDEWNQQSANRDSKYIRRVTANRNLIFEIDQQIEEGLMPIVVISRPQIGVAYIGHISGSFELVNNPAWGQQYLVDRENNGLGYTADYLGDVVQSWPVDEFRQVDLSRIPPWIQRSFLGLSEWGRLQNHPLDNNLTAYQTLEEILDDNHYDPLEWTLDPDQIKMRLIDTLSTPCAFENLIVSLLQLEYPNQVWQHTGGPGDGGVDGIGSDDNGRVIGIMQAKLYSSYIPIPDGLNNPHNQINFYSAVLVETAQNLQEPDDVTYLNIDWISEKVAQHYCRLPLAQTIRVGIEI